MLIGQLKNNLKDKGKIFDKGRLFLIQQNLTQTSDFLTVSWLIHQLQNQAKVTLITFRQNYAHYLAISKKLGKSIEPYLKSKQLKYFESFETTFNSSQLPLTQTSPNSFISPPTSVTRIKQQQLIKKQNILEESSTVIVDAISFASIELGFRIYEEAMDKNCRLLFAGAMEGDEVVKIFRNQADVFIKLENDVGNHGKFKVVTGAYEQNIHWKYLQGKFELTQYIKL